MNLKRMMVYKMALFKLLLSLASIKMKLLGIEMKQKSNILPQQSSNIYFSSTLLRNIKSDKSRRRGNDGISLKRERSFFVTGNYGRFRTRYTKSLLLLIYILSVMCFFQYTNLINFRPWWLLPFHCTGIYLYDNCLKCIV